MPGPTSRVAFAGSSRLDRRGLLALDANEGGTGAIADALNESRKRQDQYLHKDRKRRRVLHMPQGMSAEAAGMAYGLFPFTKEEDS